MNYTIDEDGIPSTIVGVERLYWKVRAQMALRWLGRSSYTLSGTWRLNVSGLAFKVLQSTVLWR